MTRRLLFAVVVILGASALIASHPASARRLHVGHVGAHQGVVHMHAAGHAGAIAHPHG